MERGMDMMNNLPADGIITRPGIYILKKDYSSTKVIGVKIDANDVTLDLNGYSILNKSVESVTFGIHAAGMKNVTIKNGTISFFTFGIQAPYSANLTIQDIGFQGCTYIGANVGGSHCHVNRCVFRNITGSHTEAYSVGVNVGEADHAVIENNTFSGLYRQPSAPDDMVGEGVGILLGHGTTRCVISNNYIRNSSLRDHTYGIWAAGVEHIIIDNRIMNFQMGLMMGKSTAMDNVFFNQEVMPGSVAISGSGGASERNLIVNYEQAYVHGAVGDVNEIDEPIMSASDCIYGGSSK